MKIYATDIRRLALESNRGMMDCRRALKMFDGDAKKAYEWLLENTKEREKVVDEIVEEESISIDEPEEKLTNKERIQKGYEFLYAQKYRDFEKVLSPIAETDKEAALLLMNYFYERSYLHDYCDYKEMALKLKHPLAYYQEGKLALKQIYHHHIAFSNFVKAYQYGYSKAKDDIYKIYDVLKMKYSEHKPYQYDSMDINPFMFTYIEETKIRNHYIKYLKDQQVDESLIVEWDYLNFQDTRRYFKADYEFYHQLSDILNRNDKINFKTINGVKYYDKGLENHVLSCDDDVFKLLQEYDTIILSSLPNVLFSTDTLEKMNIHNRLDMKEYLMCHHYANNISVVFKNNYAENIISTLKSYKPYVDKKLKNNPTESLTFLKSQIIAYEECMRLHKLICNRFLALHYLWSMSEKTNFRFYDYFALAKEEILSLDKEFIMIRNAYLEQLKMLEYRDKVWCQGGQYDEQRRIERLKHKVMWNQTFDISTNINEEQLQSMIRKYAFDVAIEDVIAYLSTEQNNNFFVLTKDMLYSNQFKKGVSLQDFICLRVDDERNVYGLYRTGERQIAMRDKGIGLSLLIDFIDELVFYL